METVFALQSRKCVPNTSCQVKKHIIWLPSNICKPIHIFGNCKNAQCSFHVLQKEFFTAFCSAPFIISPMQFLSKNQKNVFCRKNQRKASVRNESKKAGLGTSIETRSPKYQINKKEKKLDTSTIFTKLPPPPNHHPPLSATVKTHFGSLISAL